MSNASDGTPISHAYVVLASDTLVEVARVVTDSNGMFRMLVARDGQYYLRAELIGFDATPSEPFRATTTTRRQVDYAVELTPIRLTVSEQRNRECDSESPAAALAWRETQKALRALTETSTRGHLELEARLFQRVSRVDGSVVREIDSVLTGLHEIPFVRYATDAVERREGYVVELADETRGYIVPDPSDLAQDDFSSTHCFWLSQDTITQDVVLHFAPRESIGGYGLTGGFTLGGTDARLRTAYFRFDGGPGVPAEIGPTATFDVVQVDPANWFIKSWQLALPILAARSDSVPPTVSGTDETGAHVLDAMDGTGNTVWSDDAISVLYGSVFDSVSNAPLEDGIVAIAGTRHHAQTDASGGFALAGYWDGNYGVVFGHQRLDSLGFVSPVHIVHLRPGSEAALSLAVPALDRIIEKRCPELTESTGRMLVGVVRDEETQLPTSGALVTISRDLVPERFHAFVNERSNDIAVTDSLGMYTVCDVPIGVPISVAATKGDKQSSFYEATFWQDTVTFGSNDPLPLPFPVGRLDMLLRSVDTYFGALTGTVTDAMTGFVVPDVRVSIEGTAQSTVTDSAGVFSIENVPDGLVQLSLRKVGYRMLRHSVRSSPGDHLVLSAGTLQMNQADQDAVTLDPILVQAEGLTPKLSEFEERRSTGFGSFVTKDEFDEWNPTVATDVLRRMRGVRIRPNPYFGVDGDNRKNLIEPARDVGQRVTRVIAANETRGLTSRSGGNMTVYECPMLIFLDGVFLGDSYGTDVDAIVSTTDLSAVEVYSPSQVPVQFALPGSTCGVVVFWSY